MPIMRFEIDESIYIGLESKYEICSCEIKYLVVLFRQKNI